MDVESLRIDRTQGSRTPARRRRRLPLWPLLLIAVAALAWLFWTPLAGLIDAVRLPRVRVLDVVESSAAAVGAVRGTAANGYVVAARRAALSADTPGRIVELNVTEGSVVEEGFVVARLFADEYRAALQRAEADLAVAEAGLAGAEAAASAADTAIEQRRRLQEAAAADLEVQRSALVFAAAQLARSEELARQRLRPQEQLDDAVRARDGARSAVAAADARVRAADAAVRDAQAAAAVARADVATAQAQVAAACAALDLAAATLEKTNVRAPFDGIVVLKDAEVGEVVSPNSQGGSNARGSVCTMVDFASLEIQADVPEQNLAAVEPGAPADVYLDAWPDHRYAGRVDRIWPTANRQKATVEVRVRLDQLDQRLRPDMGVRVVFRPAPAEGAEPQPAAGEGREILIPTEAVVDAPEGGAGVFIVVRDTVRFTAVELGDRRAARVVVRGGLRPGQRIVLSPPASLHDGDRVQILSQPQ